MQNVITLITDYPNKILDESVINKAFIALEKKGGKVINLQWLSQGEACDIIFDELDEKTAREALSKNLSKYEVDFTVQENQSRKKKLLISDMDSTIIQQECIDEIAAKIGIKDKIAQITERAMNGELDFKSSLEERVSLLKGISESELENVYNDSITTMPGAIELVKTMKANGAYCLLVSGGFTFFTSKIQEKLGFDDNKANTLSIENGKLTGKVVDPILDANSKLIALNETIEKLNLKANDTLAIGDGANDLPMLKNAGIGIATHAKVNVRKQVKHNIFHTGLKSILFIQGYKKSEFSLIS